jgi:hypothetical protein
MNEIHFHSFICYLFLIFNSIIVTEIIPLSIIISCAVHPLVGVA